MVGFVLIYILFCHAWLLPCAHLTRDREEVDPEGMGNMEELGGVKGEEQKQKKNKNRKNECRNLPLYKKMKRKLAKWHSQHLLLFMALKKSLCLTVIWR